MPAGHILGPTGNLIEFPDWLGSLGRSMERPTTLGTNLAGQRIAQQVPELTGSSTWQVPHLSPDQSGAVEELLRHHPGPWWAISPWAHQHNALWGPGLPQATGGPLDLGGGVWSAVSWTITSTVTWPSVPMRAGESVTVSAWVQRSGTTVTPLFIQFLDAAGGVLASSGPAWSPAVLSRQHGTFTAPAGTVACRLRFTGSATNPAIVARPAITWTPTVTTWTAPAAIKVVATGLRHEPVSAAELDGLASEGETTLTLEEVTR